jgi:hypothetical protein
MFEHHTNRFQTRFGQLVDECFELVAGHHDRRQDSALFTHDKTRLSWAFVDLEFCVVAERNSKSIIYSFSEILPAPDVPLGGLHRCVTEEKLNLFELTSRLMAEACACATKIVGSKMVNTDSLGISLHGVPDYVCFHSITLLSAILRNSPEHLAFSHSRVMEPTIYQTFTPDRHGNRSQSSTLPNHIDDHQVVLPRLQLIQS